MSEDAHKTDKKEGNVSVENLTPAELKHQAKLKQRAQQKKDRQEKEKQQMNAEFRAFRTYLLLALVLMNAILSIAVTSSVSSDSSLRDYYLWYIFGLVAFFNGKLAARCFTRSRKCLLKC